MTTRIIPEGACSVTIKDGKGVFRDFVYYQADTIEITDAEMDEIMFGFLISIINHDSGPLVDGSVLMSFNKGDFSKYFRECVAYKQVVRNEIVL